MKKTIFTVLSLIAFNSANAFDLKGYTLGDELTACPADSKKAPELLRGMETCELGNTTFLGIQGTQFLLRYENKVTGIMISIPHGGRNGYSEIYSALREKFGYPRSSKSHINEYQWEHGDNVLKLDGWGGTIVALDTKARRNAEKATVAANKSDM
jgi:hypothetical protein